MSDAIGKWTEETMEESKFMWDYIQQQKLDDSFGWGAMMQVLVSRMGTFMASHKEKKASSCGLLLTGPDGCGKHTAAAHMMTHLGQEGYQMIFLTGRTLAPLGLENARKVVDTLLADCEKHRRSVCIQLEEMEEVPFRRELLTIFGQQLQNYTFYDDCRLFLILIDNREKELPHCLRSQLLLCRMQPPNLEQRRTFLENRDPDLKRALSVDKFAQLTQGATYAQLQDMMTALNWHLDARDVPTINDEELTAFLAGQMPAPTREDALQQLAQSAKTLADRLPQALANQGGGRTAVEQAISSVSAATSVDGKNFNEASYIAKRTEELKNMPTYELTSAVFSQEQKAVIYNRTQTITQ